MKPLNYTLPKPNLNNTNTAAAAETSLEGQGASMHTGDGTREEHGEETAHYSRNTPVIDLCANHESSTLLTKDPRNENDREAQSTEDKGMAATSNLTVSLPTICIETKTTPKQSSRLQKGYTSISNHRPPKSSLKKIGPPVSGLQLGLHAARDKKRVSGLQFPKGYDSIANRPPLDLPESSLMLSSLEATLAPTPVTSLRLGAWVLAAQRKGQVLRSEDSDCGHSCDYHYVNEGLGP